MGCSCKQSVTRPVRSAIVDFGVQKQDIVLGFHPPFMQEMSDYAVG